MKKYFFMICLGVLMLILSGVAQADAAEIYKDRASVTFYNDSKNYTVDGKWFSGDYNAEIYNGTMYVSVNDFKDAFKVNISYNYDDFTITMKLYDKVVKQTLNVDTLYINDVPYSVPAPYVSPAEGYPVMVALEPFASVIGYSGEFEIKDTYLPGEMTLNLAKIPYTLTHIEVNQAAQLVTVFGKNPSGDTEAVRYMLCSTGVGQCTPNGTFRANPLGNDWYYFSNFNCFVRYCTQIVGNVCFHSLTFNGNYNSSLSRTAYNAIGTKASHGCIRLFVDDAKYIHENCRSLPVVITNGYTNETTDAIRENIISHKLSYEDYVKSLN